MLVVDDLQDKLLVMQTVLEGLGADIVLAHSGREALREALRREFAVVLLDVNMPDIDGFETAALMRSYRQTAHTPIIFVTAYVDEIQTAHGYALGAVDYIVAPVVPDILRSKVRVFLDLLAAQRRVKEQADERVALAEAQAARDAAEAESRRQAFLADVGRECGEVLDEGYTPGPLLALLQREFGGLAAVAVMGGVPDDEPHVSVIGAMLPAAADGASVIDLPLPALPPALIGPLEAAFEQRRRVELSASELREIDQLTTKADGDGAAHARVHLGCVLPLLVGSRMHGALLIAAARPTPVWATLDAAAQRLAMTLENARLLRDLRQEVLERRAAEERLAELNRRKDEFLAMLSHELRNPLAPIRSAAEVVKLAGRQEPRLAWASSVIGRQVDRLRRLIDELLDVARISHGKVDLRTETLDLRGVVEQAVDNVRPMVDARRLVLEVRMPEQRVWLRGDAARLAQVVDNLLTNAVKYTDEGGRIDVGLTVNDGEAELRVRDDGIGIEADLLPRVFDLFEQGHRDLDRAQGGLGVGLTLARRLVSMHQGTIEACSAGAGRGSEFIVRLPCVTDAAEHDAPVRSAAQPLADACRVLVVDDNRDAAETTAAVLSLAGHDVRTAFDGPEALATFATFAPQVVVLDIGLPGMDGYAVAAALRAYPASRDAMLIALTGYGGEADRERAHAAGFDLHLVKPADPEALEQAIERHVRRVRPSTALGSAPATRA